MANDKDKPGVLGNKDEFEKHGTGPDAKGENTKAREEMGHMAEKTKGPGTTGSGSSGNNQR